MYIAHCNKCNNNYEDNNPGAESVFYPENTEVEGQLQTMNIEDEPGEVGHCCPTCKTDA